MSFILDALKKSEIERQRQSVPGLVDSGIARPRPRLPLWAMALCLLLVVNLLVLLFMLTRSWFTMAPSVPPSTRMPQADAPASAATDRTNAPTDAQSVAARANSKPSSDFSPLDGAAPVYAPEIPVNAAADSPAAGVLPSAAHRRDPLLSDTGSKTDDYKAGDDEVLPTINEINLTGAQALPDLHLDVHVYSTQSAERFVYVNMRKYHEGATLQEGPVLERIRRDGVILDYQGLRFLLPRQ